MKKKNLWRRIIAYIIDSSIVILMTLLITNTKYLNPTYDKVLESSNTFQKLTVSNTIMQNLLPYYYNDKEITETEYNDLIKNNEYFGYLVVDAYSDSVITEDEYNYIKEEAKKIYDEKYPDIYKDTLKANWYTYLVYIIVYFAYFVIFNIITNGVTLGKKLTNLKIVTLDNKKASWVNYLIRSLILYGYFIYLFLIILPYIVPTTYIVGLGSTLSMILDALQIITAISVLTNKENRGIHDLAANTKVIYQKDGVNDISKLKLLTKEKEEELKEIILKKDEQTKENLNDNAALIIEKVKNNNSEEKTNNSNKKNKTVVMKTKKERRSNDIKD